MKKYLKMSKALSFLLCLVTVAGLLPTSAQAAKEKFTIRDITITDVVEPVAGQKPVTTCTISTPDVENEGVSWLDITAGGRLKDTDIFVAGHEYEVRVYFSPASGYTFPAASEMNATINGVVAREVVGVYGKDRQRAAAQRFTCPKTEIMSVIITDVVEPVAGQKPVTTCTISTPDVENEGVSWLDITAGGRLKDTDTFVAGHEYEVRVYFSPASGYTFPAASEMNATINGAAVKVIGIYGKPDQRCAILPFPALAAPTMKFTDVPSSAYYSNAVSWAVDKGITSGTSGTTFSPNADCTRAQIVTFLWRAAGSPAPKNSVMTFTDVPDSAYYRDAVLWAVEQKITSGTSATTFSPGSACTRSQAVTFLYRFANSPKPGGKASFSDVPDGSYYADAVTWAKEQNITSGTSATTFSPNSTCTRAQIVTFLYRLLGE